MFSLYVHGPIRMHLPTLQWVGALECMHVILEGDGDIVTIKRRYPILAPPGDLRLRRVGASTEPKVKTEGNGGKRRETEESFGLENFWILLLFVEPMLIAT